MRKLFAIIAILLYHIGINCGFVSDNRQTANVGNPAENSYTVKQAKSRAPWDMIIEDGKLYIGGGDYNDNTGPVDIHTMDLITNEWSVSGTLNDEAIGKFVRIGDRVYAPGFDAKGAKSSGNFYWLEDGQWQENTSLPNAAHNYDIIEYDGKLMFAIGTWTGSVSPVKASNDGGNSFYDIPFYKDDVNIIAENDFDFTRVYDFFVTEKGLFCVFMSTTEGKSQYYEFFEYKDGAFHFVSTHIDTGIKIKALKQEPISSEVTFQGQCYIAAYHLSRTVDFKTIEKLVLPRDEIAVDLLVEGDQMYVLCAEPGDKTCTVRIYAYVYNSFFYPLLSFESQNLPISFAKDGCSFYIGKGQQGFNDDATGSVITVSVPELTLELTQDCL